MREAFYNYPLNVYGGVTKLFGDLIRPKFSDAEVNKCVNISKKVGSSVFKISVPFSECGVGVYPNWIFYLGGMVVLHFVFDFRLGDSFNLFSYLNSKNPRLPQDRKLAVIDYLRGNEVLNSGRKVVKFEHFRVSDLLNKEYYEELVEELSSSGVYLLSHDDFIDQVYEDLRSSWEYVYNNKESFLNSVRKRTVSDYYLDIKNSEAINYVLRCIQSLLSEYIDDMNEFFNEGYEFAKLQFEKWVGWYIKKLEQAGFADYGTEVEYSDLEFKVREARIRILNADQVMDGLLVSMLRDNLYNEYKSFNLGDYSLDQAIVKKVLLDCCGV